ncbi:MAG TPA: DUF2298 domain-containing protein [Anaerolineae bacterium]|nr:DUF2298 domain-containing protein [Anaerolineae bacterium]
MGTVLAWWLWLEVAGLAALPLAFRFFRHLPDRGYAFARPLGLLLASYALWMGATLGLLRNSLGGALASLLLVALASTAVYLRGRRVGEPGLWEWLRGHGRLVLAVELLFAVTLGGWSLIRAYSPELATSGGEKFMEIMYLNAIGRSATFPPHDAWLAGYGISYYYFGYVMIAMLTKLTGLAAHLTFNVGLASLFALTCTGAFGLVYNLVGAHHPLSRGEGSKSIAYGLLGSVLVAVLGNLEGFFEVLYSLKALPERFFRWLDILEINGAFDPSVAPSVIPSRSGWWWWRASRVINDLDPLGKPVPVEPIDEFPGFSFLLGDMHPHVLALPFVLLGLAVALAALHQGKQDDHPRHGAGKWWEPLVGISGLVPLCLGALGFLNTWDMPVYLVIWLVAYGLGRWRAGRGTWQTIREIAIVGGAVGLACLLLYLPFYLGFQSQAGGVLPTAYVGTRFRHYFVIFGPFLVAIGGMLVLAAHELRRYMPARRLVASWLGWGGGFLLGPLAVMLLIVAGMLVAPAGREFLDRVRSDPAVAALVGDASLPVLLRQLALVKLRYWVMPVVVAGMAALGAVVVVRTASPSPREKDAEPENLVLGDSSPQRSRRLPGEGERPAEISLLFAAVCAAAGLLLTLSVEFVYLVDNFGVRMNTIFKFYFQAWVLLGVAATYAVYWLGRRRGWVRATFLALFWSLFCLGMVYPALGNISRGGGFAHAPTLDGMAYLAESQPDDYAAIAWLNENVEGAPVILEAPGAGGSSYVYEGRVSALTGLPTLLGWAGHEGQWRGNYTVQAAREPDIQTIYNTISREAASELLSRHNVEYVYVGPLERSKYEARGLAKFEAWLEAVYRSGGVTIYRVPGAGR